MKHRYTLVFEMETVGDEIAPMPEDIEADAMHGGLHNYYLAEVRCERGPEPVAEVAEIADPFTSEHRLCDDDGMVTGEYLDLHNHLVRLRHKDREPVTEPFHCTSHAHLAGEHIRCTSPAHSPEPGTTDRRPEDG